MFQVSPSLFEELLFCYSNVLQSFYQPPLGTYTIDVFSDGSDIVLCRFSASLDGTVSGGII